MTQKSRERERIISKNTHGLKEKINPAQISVLSHINTESIFSLESRKNLNIIKLLNCYSNLSPALWAMKN